MSFNRISLAAFGRLMYARLSWVILHHLAYHPVRKVTYRVRGGSAMGLKL